MQAKVGRWWGLIVPAAITFVVGGVGGSRLASAEDAAAVRLRYRFRKGQVLRWRVVHLATSETTIKNKTELSRTRSVAVKRWKVIDVTPEGHAVLEHQIESLQMWQKRSDHPEVRYDSRKDKTPPPEYVTAAETVGKPLARTVVTPRGREVRRDKEKPNFDLGLGGFLIPFPEDPVQVGQSWRVPRTIAVKIPGGEVKFIKVRLRYTLESVSHGVATIGVRTEVISPIRDPRIEMQLIQDLIRGTIRFDVEAGLILSRQVDWDDTVVEFAGPSSMIKYRARLTEERIAEPPRTARRPKD